jgi:threonylcarbamoyladenosine tRNA methylthiotransferase MtaB
MSITTRHTVKLETLGCKLNFSETATMQSLLAEHGILPVERGGVPDVCVVNTCSVTALADSKCRQHIRHLIRQYPDALMVVTGCYAQLKGEEIAQIDGVDIVLGSEQKPDIARYVLQWFEDRQRQLQVTPTRDIRRFSPSCDCGDRTRYWLKVQDGCDYWCTYCTIPAARGRSRSGTIAELTAQARQVAAEGGKEIVITGVNIGDFGKNTGEKFLDLLKSLDEIEEIERYRISSIEPDLLTDDIIDWCASSRAFMPHFHIPLQSGSDPVLKLMHRHYDRQLFADRVGRCRELMPDCFIGVDVMVGTRGETEAFFEDSYRFIEGLDVTQLHVFSYSERPGTKALLIDYVVPPQVKHERSQYLLELSGEKTHAFYQQFVGQEMPVLLEKSKAGQPMHGFTPNYIRVEVENRPELDNHIVMVKLGEMNEAGDALKGRILS